jgi:molybdate transport system substrate-binding protein
MNAPKVVSSMATKAVLAELARAYQIRTGLWIAVESIGGIDAAKRVEAGETFDVVVLARAAIDQLLKAGRLVAGSEANLMRSGVAVAVRAGAKRPKIGSEDALRRAVLDARSIGCSTGPSGVMLKELFARWGIGEEVGSRLVTAPPGVPVGALVARGNVELGFQQLSELIHVEGIDVVGPLPETTQILTTFSAGVAASSRRPDIARALVAFMRSSDAADAKRRQGMEPA